MKGKKSSAKKKKREGTERSENEPSPNRSTNRLIFATCFWLMDFG